MNYFGGKTFRAKLVEMAVQRAALEDRSPEALAGRYAIEMLEEIVRIMNNERTSMDDKYNAIMKVMCFINVPMHRI